MATPKNKARVRKLITQSSLALREIMEESLLAIGEAMVDQIIAKLNRLPDSRRMDAINDIKWPGEAEYRRAVKAAFATIAGEALDTARAELPPKLRKIQLAENEESIRLGEFEDLPASVRAKLAKQYQLLVDTQMSDLEKSIKFQFNHSIDSTDSILTIRDDLLDIAHEYASGPRVIAGASSMSSQVVNEARDSLFDLPEIRAQIEAFEFVNLDPKSEICNDLAGTIFSVDDPNRFRYTPPLHFNCKSYIAPILTGNLGDREVSPLKPSSKRIENTIQFSEQKCICGSQLTQALN